MTEHDFYDRIKGIFQKKAESDKRIQSILKRIESGKATFADTAEYSQLVSELLGSTLSEHLGAETTAYVKEYVCREMLRDQYESMNDLLASVQRALNEKVGLRVAPQRAAFPTERVNVIAHALEDPTVPIDVIKRRAKSPVANVSKSFHDDYIKENARFRSRAGLKCFIVRTTDGKCCKWCTAMAGRYEYGSEPHDVYRRHDNCGCTVIYESGRQRQDVWTKKTWEVPEGAKKKYEPVRLSPERAKELEQAKLLQYRGLTSGVDYMSNSFRPKFSQIETQLEISDKISITTRVVENSSFHLLADTVETRRSKAVRLVENNLKKIQNLLPDDFEMPQIAVVDFARHNLNANAIGGYHAQSGMMFINSRYNTPEKILAFVNEHKGFFANTTEFAPLLHELGHKYYEDSVKVLAKSENIGYNIAKGRIDSAIHDYIHSRNSNGRFVLEQISGYADKGYRKNKYTELIAECFSVATTNKTAADILKILRGEVI